MDERVLGAWLGNENLGSRDGEVTNLGSRDGEVTSIFSEQLKDWRPFQHKWQWDNRGKIDSEEGFTAFLESYIRQYLHIEYLYWGEPKAGSNPSVEGPIRELWKFQSTYLEQCGKDGFTAYTSAVEKRLLSHNFRLPFQLVEDPRQQDARTTWVEYLSYIYWWQDRYAALMKDYEPLYRQAWDELLSFHYASASANISTTNEPLDGKLSSIKAELAATTKKTENFIHDTKQYRRLEKAFHRQQQRAEWVLGQLPLIKETVPSLGHEAAKKDSGAKSHKKKSHKKRKLGNDDGVLSAQ